MELKKADVPDIASIMDLCRRIHPTTSYSHIPMNDRAVRALILSGIFSRNQVAYIAVSGKQVTGLLVGGIAPFVWNDRVFYASDDLFIAEKGGAYLLRRFIRWAKGRNNVKEIILGESAGSQIPAALYPAMGLKQSGGIYRMKV